MLRVLPVLPAVGLLLVASPAQAQLAHGTMDVQWNEGAPDCATSAPPPLQVHAYNPRTFILRESLCATFEAPFMYLLVGSTKALLIDTGDLADPDRAPLAGTVLELLPRRGSARLPLLVVHTHRHFDHRRGDAQFADLPGVQVVGYDLASIRRFYHFTAWPDGLGRIDLGDRIVDVIPTPGHNETEVSFYDRRTGLFFSGDFLSPARLLVDDADAYAASAARVADFVRDRPVRFVLGGHIEMNAGGELFPWKSQYHPDEHVLQMTKADLLALPAAISDFNGFYTRSGGFVLMNSIRILIAEGLAAGLALAGIVFAIVWYVRRRRRAPAPRGGGS
ncbi:MAG TPA: MBL fold metallo-hydrolase [Longimicrobiales bacterium]